MKAFCAAYVALWVGMTFAKVGELPKNTGPFDWWLPLMMFGLLAVPAVLGYLAGREDERDA